MGDRHIINFIIVISNEERNLKNVINQISQTGKPVFEMTFTKAICKK